MQDAPWIKTWELVSCENRNNSGAVEYYYGEKPFGRLSYDKAGFMYALVSKSDRIRFGSDDRSLATNDEMLAAFVSFDSYCGRYEFNVSEGSVLHKVEGSFFPNWVGLTHSRFFELKSDRLVLRTPPVQWRNNTWVFTLDWKRA